VPVYPPRIAQALDSFKARLAAEFGPRVKRIVLFGSVARGEARWDSDVDVLVLLDHLDMRERGRVIDLAADELTERDVLISPTAMSQDAFAQLEARERLLPREVARDGISL
jgi:predicted nucleotidyltransferase